MPSLKSHIIALVLRNWHRRAFTSPEGLHRWIEWARRRESFRPPPAVSARFDISVREIVGSPVYEVRPKQLKSRLHLLYLHGGAFVFQITSYHWNLIAELAERLGMAITVPIYPLAPQHQFNDIFATPMQVYRDLLERMPAREIGFVGDSAGANMAVVMTMLAAEEKLPSPAAHVLVSPGLDMSLTNPDLYEFAKADPWLAIPGGLEAIRLYAPDLERDDWRISPTYGDLAVLPKTLLLTSTRDLLYPDNIVFAEKARARGVDVELFVEPGMIHVWPLLAIREARPARDRIVSFLEEVDPAKAGPSQNLPVSRNSSNAARM
jgi:acetyl esterase/lipase